MSLSQILQFFFAPDPEAATSHGPAPGPKVEAAGGGSENEPESACARHLTDSQREVISRDLQKSEMLTGPVSMTASASDDEAVGFQTEIANVLEETGFEVEIDNSEKELRAQEMPAGVEMVVKDKTIRPAHAASVVGAFRRAGVAIATRISKKRQKNDTLYITVGANVPPPLVSETTDT